MFYYLSLFPTFLSFLFFPFPFLFVLFSRFFIVHFLRFNPFQRFCRLFLGHCAIFSFFFLPLTFFPLFCLINTFLPSSFLWLFFSLFSLIPPSFLPSFLPLTFLIFLVLSYTTFLPPSFDFFFSLFSLIPPSFLPLTLFFSLFSLYNTFLPCFNFFLLLVFSL